MSDPLDPNIKGTPLETEFDSETALPLWEEPLEPLFKTASDTYEFAKREAQVAALLCMNHNLADWMEKQIQVLDYPWSDARYPSIVKIWGIDSLEEEAAPYLDHVWLDRYHPDRPQRWIVAATTTSKAPLAGRYGENGERLAEGTRDYLERTLQDMCDCSFDRSARQLGKVLTQALAEGQLIYKHVDCAFDEETQAWFVNDVYDFPIYPALYTEPPEDEVLLDEGEDVEGDH
jgi:hypothetical protein